MLIVTKSKVWSLREIAKFIICNLVSILLIFKKVKYSKSFQGQFHKGLELGVFLSICTIRLNPTFMLQKTSQKLGAMLHAVRPALWTRLLVKI